MPPKISVIIPVYNVSEYLDECLRSAVGQTLQDIEIIVVNDGSTDNSQEIIDRYAAGDNRIVPVVKKNEGLANARKSGLEKAQGEYIFHFDGDDYLPLDALEGLYAKAVETKADIVTACIYVDFGNDNIELHCYEDFDVLSNEE
ncbi:MAG: glycosyltransferase family 2 protein, partial [Sphingobacteriales bacterium]